MLRDMATTSTERTLRLLALLQGGGELSGALLARRLGVSERTVQRDAARLRELGYDVRARPGPGAGYRLRPGVRVPPLLLGADEAGAVAAGLAVLSAWMPDDEAVATAAVKLAQVLPPGLARRARAVALSFGMLERERPAVSMAAIGTLADAVADGARVRFAYTDAAGRPSRRLVEPYRTVLREAVWYLVGYDVDRDAWRLFRLDRLRDVEPVPSTGRPREFPAESVEEWLATDFGRAP
ncbi:helix-turn-helix transcriptional regulator [Microbacterium sp.]|uniref:helix-turn-helix transcriptional regulator n=1 Tax=Microbacterium sp. TaxID=51671 RepID=UPI002811484E|nr:WYL domain-containing protein [Microbacterium sp.]